MGQAKERAEELGCAFETGEGLSDGQFLLRLAVGRRLVDSGVAVEDLGRMADGCLVAMSWVVPLALVEAGEGECTIVSQLTDQQRVVLRLDSQGLGLREIGRNFTGGRQEDGAISRQAVFLLKQGGLEKLDNATVVTIAGQRLLRDVVDGCVARDGQQVVEAAPVDYWRVVGDLIVLTKRDSQAGELLKRCDLRDGGYGFARELWNQLGSADSEAFGSAMIGFLSQFLKRDEGVAGSFDLGVLGQKPGLEESGMVMLSIGDFGERCGWGLNVMLRCLLINTCTRLGKKSEGLADMTMDGRTATVSRDLVMQMRLMDIVGGGVKGGAKTIHGAHGKGNLLATLRVLEEKFAGALVIEELRIYLSKKGWLE